MVKEGSAMKAGGQSFTFDLPALQTWMRRLFDPAWGKGTIRLRLILGAMAIAWFAIVLATMWHHEFQEDEVRALSIATGSPSLWQIPVFLKNEGHPVVWYVLLRTGYQALGSTVLPVVSFLVAGTAIAIFLFCAPFSLGLKGLFTFSVLPLYEYSVMARNYGISMLLMFSFAALYPYRRRRPLVLALVLAMLANTNVHSLLMAGLLTVLWLWDEAVDNRRSLSARQLLFLSLAAVLIFAAALFAIKTILPDERTVATHVFQAKTFDDYLSPFLRLLIMPWTPVKSLIPLGGPGTNQERGHGWPWRLVQVLLLGMLLLGLAVCNARLALAFLTAFLGLGYFFNFAYYGALRHQGILLIFILVLYWLNAESGPAVSGLFHERFHPLAARSYSFALLVALPLLLGWNDYLAFYKIQVDFKMTESSTKPFADWLNIHPEYQDSIILGEPAAKLEALPYYAAQRIYIPRESRFGKWTRLTTEAKRVMSLGELLDVAQKLKEQEHQTILVALGFPSIVFEQRRWPGYARIPHLTYIYPNGVQSLAVAAGFKGWYLTWTPTEWERFKQSTKRVAAFWASRDGTGLSAPTEGENFDIYEIQ